MFLKKTGTFLFIALIFTGCQTYTNENEKIRADLYNGKYNEAIKKLDESSFSKEKQNYSLFLMEKGMLLYLQDNYKDAVNSWVNSDKHLDELYTTSISKTASSLIINDSKSDYTGEAHERVLLPIFSSLALFANKDNNNAIAMIRRTNDIKHEFSAKEKYKNILKYDLFSSYFSGLMYENKNEWDNAIIEYKKALNNFNENNKNTDNNQQIENFILKDLARLAEYRKRNDILKEIDTNRRNIKWISQDKFVKMGEIYVVYESGISPIKVAKNIPFVTNKTYVNISFPEYKQIPYKNHYSEIFINNVLVGKTLIFAEIGKMAKESLENRKAADLTKIAARVIAKDVATRKIGEQNPLAGLAANIFSMSTEVADTRSWTSLPDTIQIYRITVTPNKEFTLKIKPEFGSPIEQSITLNAGEKKLIRFRTFD
jgi:hypothetical protein